MWAENRLKPPLQLCIFFEVIIVLPRRLTGTHLREVASTPTVPAGANVHTAVSILGGRKTETNA